MSKKNIGQLIKISGVILGAIMALTLISKHPVQISFLALGFIVYLAGDKVKRS